MNGQGGNSGAGNSLLRAVTGLIVGSALLLRPIAGAAGDAPDCPFLPTVGTAYYVRACDAAQCRDTNSGKRPSQAWATIANAAKVVKAGNPGDTVIVGPGTYHEGDIIVATRNTGSTTRPITFVADPSGACTGDAPGPVLIDVPKVDQATTKDTGFLVNGGSDVVISGFRITHARIAAIQIHPDDFDNPSDRVVIANNVLFENGAGDLGRGVDIADVSAPTIFNNLIYGNTSTGIGILGTDNAHIINNTLYGHATGIVIADDILRRPSTQAWMINNIIAGFGTSGISVDAGSSCDYIGAYNLLSSADNGTAVDYEGLNTPRDTSDLRDVSPGFADPADGDFRLEPGSPAVNSGSTFAALLGLNAATTQVDASPDADRVDLGYHYGNVTAEVFSAPPVERQDLYVDPDGSDANDGLTPTTPLRTIGQAAQIARAVSRVVVAPGVYADHVGLKAIRPAGPLEFYGDETGAVTGNAPGLVVMDATGQEDGFNINGHCSTVIDGFVIKGAQENGIFVKGADHSIVRDNRILSNGSLGIKVIDANDVQIVNNLIYANGDFIGDKGGGIEVGASDLGNGSAGTSIESNTVYGNSVNGILIGTGGRACPGSQVRYNVISGNGGRGLQLDNNDSAGISAVGLCVEYNLNHDSYGRVLLENCDACVSIPDATEGGMTRPCGGAPCYRTGSTCGLRGYGDSAEDPRFADRVSGGDGCLGGAAFWDDTFRLAPSSDAVDIGLDSAKAVDLDERTTRTDNVDDRGKVDAGYHYVTAPPENIPPVPGDCDHDRRVTVSELVRGVRIALALLPVDNCPDFDSDDDGRVDVRELSAAVGASLTCRGRPLL